MAKGNWLSSFPQNATSPQGEAQWFSSSCVISGREEKVAQSCLTATPCYRVHGILQPRILELGSLSHLQGILPTQESNPGVPHWGRILYTGWATTEVQERGHQIIKPMFKFGGKLLPHLPTPHTTGISTSTNICFHEQTNSEAEETTPQSRGPQEIEVNKLLTAARFWQLLQEAPDTKSQGL